MTNEQHQIKVTTEVDSAQGQSSVQALNQRFNELTDTIAANAAAAEANAAAQDVARASQRAAADASKNLREGLQGIAGVANIVDPTLGRAVSLMNQLKLAEEGVAGASANVTSGLSSIVTLLSNPYFLAAAAVFAAIAYAISLTTKANEEAAKAQAKANEETQKAIELQKQQREQDRERQRETAATIAKELDQSGVLGRGGEDPKEQERRVLRAVATAQRQSGYDDTQSAIAAAIQAEQLGKGGNQQFINELTNLLIFFKNLAENGGKPMPESQIPGFIGTSFSVQAEAQAAQRRRSTLGQVADESANQIDRSADLSGTEGARRRGFEAVDSRAAEIAAKLTEERQTLQDKSAFDYIKEGEVFLDWNVPRRDRERMEEITRELARLNRVVNGQRDNAFGGQGDQSIINAGIVVQPGGSAVIYTDGDRLQPGPAGYTESPSRSSSD